MTVLNIGDMPPLPHLGKRLSKRKIRQNPRHSSQLGTPPFVSAEEEQLRPFTGWRAELEQELESARSHAFVRAASASATPMIWISGPDSRCSFFFNSRWLEFRGRAIEQEVGEGWMEGVHPDDLERCLDVLRIASANRQPFRTKFRLQRAGGIYATVSFNGVPRYLVNGKFIGHLASVHETKPADSSIVPQGLTVDTAQHTIRRTLCDIAANFTPSWRTHKGSAQQFTNRSDSPLAAETLLACLDHVPSPTLVLDDSGRVVYCNLAFRAFAADELALVLSAQNPQALQSAPAGASASSDGAASPREVQAWLDSNSLPDALSGRILVYPLPAGQKRLTCFSIANASHEDRGSLHERAFLHNVLNAAGGVEMLTELLAESAFPDDLDEYIHLLQQGVKRLMSQIRNEQMLLKNEKSVPSA